MNSWPHGPAHNIKGAGVYMVTAATYNKQHFFRDPERLELLQETLFDAVQRLGWQLQAWAIFSNHYHFIGISPEQGNNLARLTNTVHGVTAKALNRQDGTRGRRVWFEYWDTPLTYERSTFARMAYVHKNPVHHKLVEAPELYPWCSARWFLEKGDRAFRETVLSFKTDRLRIPDDF